ncbi:MAG: DUF424 family protein [Candidatus Micrarchaeota archaeon]|nr:DUF424 family protein [Candidatus Micrarchaeota archaeon]
MIYIKIHSTDNGPMLALCDSNLIEKILEEGELVINIKDYADFYKGDLIKAEELGKHIDSNEVYSANVIGKESVDAAVQNRIIDKAHVRAVNKVPYAHAFRIKY